MSLRRLGSSCSALLYGLFAAAMPLTARADTDACNVLTAAQVGAAVGIAVSEGQHVTPTFVRTCTWNASGTSDVKFVTLYLQTAADYEGGKQMASQMANGAKGSAVKTVGIGDEGYYFVTGDQVGLLVKKGSVSFKVAVYAKLPVDKKEAMELTLAKDVLTKL